MNAATIIFILIGLIGFGAGAYFAGSGQRPLGVLLMGAGLVFQALALRQLRLANGNRKRGGEQ